MKSIHAQWRIIALFITVIAFNSCKDVHVEEAIYTANVPVYISFSEFRSGVQLVPAKSLTKPGKIYFKDNYLYIIDQLEGIHIIDNANPQSPVNTAYIVVPGIVDLSAKENILYADSYIDLVAIDISDPLNAREINRLENVFQRNYPQTENNYRTLPVDETKGVVTSWKVEEVIEKRYVGERNSPGIIHYYDRSGMLFLTEKGPSHYSGPAPTNNGKSGSMARFTSVKDFLYAINNSEMVMINVADASQPAEHSRMNVRSGIETLFPAENYLFMGTITGMIIYDISNPSTPNYLSEFRHARSCDPVVVEGSFAYVTLRSGSRCEGFSNQLDVINIENMNDPRLMKSYQLTNPHGLGIDDGNLFICDGSDGLKAYDARDPLNIDKNMKGHFKDIHAYDVIPYNGILMMIGDDGLYQYKYDVSGNIEMLSKIPVNA